MEKYVYRVVWRREDVPPDINGLLEVKSKRKVVEFKTEVAADRRLTLLGPEPWRAFGISNEDADEPEFCCSGMQCGCAGRTPRVFYLEERDEMPPIKYAHIERREVGEWEELPTTPAADKGGE